MKDAWYEHLSRVPSKVPRHDVLLITGDLNAKVGAANTNHKRAMGKHSCGVMNNNGECLADFRLNNNCIIGGTIFPHKTIHKLTCRSPDGWSFNQIDQIIVNGKWQRSLTGVRAFRGADVFSDHHLITATVKLKLRKVKKHSQQRKQLDTTKRVQVSNSSLSWRLGTVSEHLLIEQKRTSQSTPRGMWSGIP